MSKQQYIMIGTKTISKDIFRNVLRPMNNFHFLPNGGLWSCEYDANDFYISDWFRYVTEVESELAAHKDITSAVIFTLKNDARILVINSYEDLLEIIKEYPSYYHLLNYCDEVTSRTESINFELLSRDYDGIYVNYKELGYSSKTWIFHNWAVNTLLLFNLDVIESYKKATINFFLPGSYFYHFLEEESTIYQVEEESIEHKELYNYIQLTFNTLMNGKNDFTDYDEYFSYVIECIKSSLNIALNNDRIMSLATKIKENLKDKNINVSEYIIIRNITTNVLSNHLRDNAEKEKTIPKTKVRRIKEYPIE